MRGSEGKKVSWNSDLPLGVKRNELFSARVG